MDRLGRNNREEEDELDVTEVGKIRVQTTVDIV
jgi:hypothetical protein